MNKPLTFKQRIVRLIVESLGQRYDDRSLDCTSGAHPAYDRGFNDACLACGREITMLANTPRLNPKERLNALNDYARVLHEKRAQEVGS